LAVRSKPQAQQSDKIGVPHSAQNHGIATFSAMPLAQLSACKGIMVKYIRKPIAIEGEA
jgi:hypothetical protein